MRIAVDTQSTLGRKTGIGHYATQLLAALRRVAPENEYIEFNCARDVVMRTDRRIAWQQWGLPRRARAARPDLLHVPGFDAPLWKPCPVVLTVHDLIGMLYPQNLPKVSRLYWSRWLPFTTGHADAIIADSECTRRDILRLLRLPPERVQVIHLGVEERFHPQHREATGACRSRYRLPEEFILYVGTLEPRKGVDTLINAYVKLAGRYPHQLVIAGKRGWYYQSIFQRVADLGLAGRVRFLDYVPDDDLPSLYASATVFAFPSSYEGFGLPVLEAMASGTPVVCSDGSSLREIAAQSALAVPSGQPEALAAALESVLAGAGLRDDLRQKGLERAAKFTWEKTARETLEVYRRVAGKSQRANR